MGVLVLEAKRTRCALILTYPKHPTIVYVKMENTRAEMPLSILKENMLKFL